MDQFVPEQIAPAALVRRVQIRPNEDVVAPLRGARIGEAGKGAGAGIPMQPDIVERKSERFARRVRASDRAALRPVLAAPRRGTSSRYRASPERLMP